MNDTPHGTPSWVMSTAKPWFPVGPEPVNPLPGSNAYDAEPHCEPADVEVFQRFRQRRMDRLEQVVAELEALRQEQRRIQSEIDACNVILGERPEAAASEDEEIPDTPTLDAASINPADTQWSSPDIAESVEAAISVLEQHGPLHYKQVYERVAQMGIRVVGKYPDGVLLSRFSRDSRVHRVAKGTYDVSR